MEQLVALGDEPRDQDSATKSLATLRNELAEEKLALEKAQTDAETLSRVVEELKKMANQCATQVPSLETWVKKLSDKIADLNIKLHARELSLEQTTAAMDDFQCQSTRLTKKLEVNYSSFLHHLSLMPSFAHY
jgi:chromosome segregation ATPase